MARTKVPNAALRAFPDEGHSQADAARHFGVSEPAIHQRLKRLRRLTSQVVALEKAGAVVDEQLTATARLERVQRVIDEELTWAIEHAREDGGDLITAYHASKRQRARTAAGLPHWHLADFATRPPAVTSRPACRCPRSPSCWATRA